MKRSGFLKALGVMIAAPSVVKAIPTVAVRQASVKAVKEKKVAESKHPRGVYQIIEIISQHSGCATIRVTPKGLRAGDYIRSGRQLFVANHIVGTSLDYNILNIYRTSPEPFDLSDPYLYTVFQPIGEHS